MTAVQVEGWTAAHRREAAGRLDVHLNERVIQVAQRVPQRGPCPGRRVRGGVGVQRQEHVLVGQRGQPRVRHVLGAGALEAPLVHGHVLEEAPQQGRYDVVRVPTRHPVEGQKEKGEEKEAVG